MGAAQSSDAASTNGSAAEQVQYGFHVLRVDEHSPAYDAKLVPFFDFITSVNGVQVVRVTDPALIYHSFIDSGEPQCGS